MYQPVTLSSVVAGNYAYSLMSALVYELEHTIAFWLCYTVVFVGEAKRELWIDLVLQTAGHWGR